MEKKINSELIAAHESLLSWRKAFTVVLLVNFAFLIERTIFDFMGFMFGMIIADLLFLFFLVTGLFGAFQYRVNYIVALILASLFWIAWNLFVICNYLNVGTLERMNPNILNLNTNKTSWWFKNNIGCVQPYPYLLADYQNLQIKSMALLSTPENVEAVANTREQLALLRYIKTTSNSMAAVTRDMTAAAAAAADSSEVLATTMESYASMDDYIKQKCFLPYYYIEIGQCAALIFCGALAIVFGLVLSNIYKDESLTNEAMEAMDRVTIVTNTNEPSMLPPSASETFKFDPCYIYGGGGGTKF